MRAATLILLCAFLVGSVRAGDAPKKVTKTSRRAFDIPEEVAAFVTDLVKNNSEVQAQYQKLTAKTEQEAGGRFRTGSFVAIEWLVPNSESEPGKEGGTSDIEYVYLVQQQLIHGFHRGYSVDDNVVARVSVTLHDERKPDPRRKDLEILARSTINLVFEGFVEVTITPK